MTFDDGAERPVIRATVRGAGGLLHSEIFLVDSAADRTVFSAGLLGDLRLPVERSQPAGTLRGIAGATPHVVVSTAIDLRRDDGRFVSVRGPFAAFLDADASDHSILGRDVLDNFDVIISRRRNEVLLLAPNHHYQIVRLP